MVQPLVLKLLDTEFKNTNIKYITFALMFTSEQYFSGPNVFMENVYNIYLLE